MTLQELQHQASALSVQERWRLVESILSSIEQDTVLNSSQPSCEVSISDLDPWTQSLVGVISLDDETPETAYVDYLEAKYS